MRTVQLMLASAAGVVALAGTATAAPPQYAIFDMGLIGTDTASQANRVSDTGIVVGRSLGTQSHAYSWTQGGGTVGLVNLTTPNRPFGVANGVNSFGSVVGVAASTAFGSGRLPVIWQGGTVAQLPLPAGQTLGDANDINDSGLAVGSVGSGSAQRAAYYQGGVGTALTATGPGGTQAVTLFSINNAGRAVGQGIDPNNAARNVGFVVDIATNIAFEIPALPGMNGALCFDISSNGFIVGTSMLNQGNGTPFFWSQGGGTVAIPVIPGYSTAIARGVNADGWVVGNGGAATSMPWLFDGTQSYRINDLLPAGSGWDLVSGTSNSAMGISDNGIIVGTGLHNGQVHGYAMIPVPTPGAASVLLLAGIPAAARRRR